MKPQQEDLCGNNSNLTEHLFVHGFSRAKLAPKTLEVSEKPSEVCKERP